MPYAQNRKLENQILQILTIPINQDLKTTKYEPGEKQKGSDIEKIEKMKYSQIFEFLVLPFTQNQKVGNLGKFCFIWLFITLLNVAALK